MVTNTLINSQYAKYNENYRFTNNTDTNNAKKVDKTTTETTQKVTTDEYISDSLMSAPTKMYIEAVLKRAVDNIERGINVEDNENIVRFYSTLLQKNPQEIINSYTFT